MDEIFKPADARQLQDSLAWACAESRPIEVIGGGTKRALGRPMQVAHVLDCAALSGITLYEPCELVMTARAGTPLAEVEAALAANRQRLAFEPPDLGPLLGGPAGRHSIGGVFAAGLAGPRRVSAGAARDHILGVACVSGRGEAFRAGGRVVKNVTGFDISKLIAGSYGTLAVMTEVTFKVLPEPEETRTLIVPGLDDDRAVGAMTQALRSSHDVSGAAHLPPVVAARSAFSAAGTAVTAVRLEGPSPSVVHRAAALREELAAFGPCEALQGDEARGIWRELRDIAPLAGTEGAVWRLAVPPAAGARVAGEIQRTIAADLFYDRGGGLIWLAVPAARDAAAGAIRDAVAGTGGTATLIRAPAGLRADTPAFQPQPEPLRRLAARVKEAFDPNRILNPGRMYAGL